MAVNIARAELVAEQRIGVRTQGDFQTMLAACKSVAGGRWNGDEKFWHYPRSLDTCHALRRAFGDALRVGNDLAAWYRHAAAEAATHRATGQATDAPLPRLAARYPEFWAWLRPAQRAGAAWLAQGYRGAGLNGDHPGLGKTTETLAALIEAGVTGPVLVVCPKASVRKVWGKEIKRHLPDVPTYLCYGTRARRQRQLDQFADDLSREWRAHEGREEQLRIVVIVAEMLRIELGDPCYTASGNKVSGMCPQHLQYGVCTLHERRPATKDKDKVPVGFSFPILFAGHTSPERAWSAVIIDESHKLMGSLTVVKGNLMGRGLKMLPERAGTPRYALSGTPFGRAGRAEGIFGTLHWLWPDEYPSFWRFVEQNFEMEDNEFFVRGGRGRVQHSRKVGALKGLAKNATLEQEVQAYETFLQSLGPRVLRRTKGEVLKNLPPKIYVDVDCEMTDRQRKQYAELLQWREVSTPAGPVVVNGTLALWTRSRQLANGAITKSADDKVQFLPEGGKLDRLLSALETRGILGNTPGTKIAVASAFNEYLDMVAGVLQGLGVPVVRYDGSRTQNQRDEAIDRWQASPYGGHDEPRVLLLNALAGGLSITLDMADEMHLMDELSDPGANEQLEDRIHRASRDHQVTIYTYRTEGTIDRKRADDIEYRRRVQHLVLDGSRGVPDLRALLTEAFNDQEEQ